MKARKKPVEVEAIQWLGNLDSFAELVNFANVTKYSQLTTSPIMIEESDMHNYIYINTLEGEMRASVSDYIIKGVEGEFYPCKPDIFEKTYDTID